MKFRGIILSAGLGVRMKPFTDFIPKPLAPICGKTLLSGIIEKMLMSGTESIAINLHYKSDKIVKTIRKEIKDKIYFSFEKKILGTGGAILKCKDFLTKRDFFILHNGDIISSVKLTELIDFHLKSKLCGSLLLVNGDDNKISVSDCRVTGIKGYCGNTNNKLFTYSGIAIFNKSVFDFFPEEKIVFPLVEVFKRLIDAKQLGALYKDNIYWRDIGSIEKYFAIHEDILLRKIYTPPWLSKIKTDIPHEGFLSLPENGICEIRKGAILKNCILLPGTRIKEGELRQNEIIGKNFSVHRDSNKILSLPFFKRQNLHNLHISNLQEQGSNRLFYRIRRSGEKTKILMISNSEDKDFMRFLKIARYFQRLNINAPEIYMTSPVNYAVLLEDLGKITLNMAVKNSSNKIYIYKKVLNFLVDFQNKTYKTAKKVIKRDFDFDGLRWESNYFYENFIKKFVKIDLLKFKNLDNELDTIAQNALRIPQLLCHRDFQSQNIMLKGGKVFVVDFQGARLGPLTYDLMSLLRDAYVSLNEDEIIELEDYYFGIFSKSFVGVKLGITREDFAKFATISGLQRAMQVLGAFAFLGLEKKKKFYISFIPRAFYNLTRLLERYSSLHLDSPKDFTELIRKIQKKFEFYK
ncbi:MAG TPA: sugar phosphate nucleotidyltransferase [Victivallales bacterium]|nr:sugar phosphate nucleotidyltransferase [Victivallales bacterium]